MTSNCSSGITAQFWTDGDRCVLRDAIFDEEDLRGLAAPNHTVPYGTGSFGGRFPGASCQATIVLSLRDEKYILCAEALSKLALMGLNPGLSSIVPSGHITNSPATELVVTCSLPLDQLQARKRPLNNGNAGEAVQ